MTTDHDATTIEASFEVKGWDENPFEEGLTDENPALPKLTRAVVTKEYSGDLTGTSLTEWLMAYDADGSATFVGMERVTGAIDGEDGTVVLQHVGAFADGAATATLTVVPGSGTGSFEGAAGSGDFRADPAGSIQLDVRRS